ncbi:unnamed protein product, partial [Meganyctiphanes norvegica]
DELEGRPLLQRQRRQNSQRTGISNNRGVNDYGRRQGFEQFGYSGGYASSDMYGHYDGYGNSGGYGYSGGYGHGGYGRDDQYGGYGAHDDGYGHSGGYGHSDYKMGVMLDPYLILGGIGAAAFLAFIAYRILVTTAAAGGGGAPR